MELRIRSRVRRLSTSANYTFLEGHIVESRQAAFPNRTGDPLLRRPKHAADVTATWIEADWNARWSTRYVGRRADSDFFTFSRPLFSNQAYWSSDAAVTYDFPRFVSAYLRIENIFDRSFQEVLGYQALGRSASVGVKVRVGADR
jgi:vitamin B12 transporter